MSVRIKISYTEEEELDKIRQRLSPDVERCRPAKGRKGGHKNAYIYMKSDFIKQK